MPFCLNNWINIYLCSGQTKPLSYLSPLTPVVDYSFKIYLIHPFPSTYFNYHQHQWESFFASSLSTLTLILLQHLPLRAIARAPQNSRKLNVISLLKYLPWIPISFRLNCQISGPLDFFSIHFSNMNCLVLDCYRYFFIKCCQEKKKKQTVLQPELATHTQQLTADPRILGLNECPDSTRP